MSFSGFQGFSVRPNPYFFRTDEEESNFSADKGEEYVFVVFVQHCAFCSKDVSPRVRGQKKSKCGPLVCRKRSCCPDWSDIWYLAVRSLFMISIYHFYPMTSIDSLLRKLIRTHASPARAACAAKGDVVQNHQKNEERSLWLSPWALRKVERTKLFPDDFDLHPPLRISLQIGRKAQNVWLSSGLIVWVISQILDSSPQV